MTAQLRWLLDDSEGARRLAAHGHRTVLSRHTCAHRVDELMEVVAELESREARIRSEEHTSELQSPCNLVCRLLLEKKHSRLIPTVQRPALLLLHNAASWRTMGTILLTARAAALHVGVLTAT